MRTRNAVIARYGLASAVLAAAAMASAQEYPAKPVRVISQGAVGGAADVTARIVADQLARIWNQSVFQIDKCDADQDRDKRKVPKKKKWSDSELYGYR